MAEEKSPSPTPAQSFTTRRRSERLYLTIPIRVSGTDPKGRDFSEECVSVDVSRHGARVRLKSKPRRSFVLDAWMEGAPDLKMDDQWLSGRLLVEFGPFQ